jgi:hypothetical protein
MSGEALRRRPGQLSVTAALDERSSKAGRWILKPNRPITVVRAALYTII